MAKSKRKKKEKQADFRKIKLKVGKKLTKSQDTDTSFQAKKVLLQDQLKKYRPEQQSVGTPDGEVLDSSFGITGKQSIPLTELCHNLKHHNKNVRKDSLLTLKVRLVDACPGFISSNLSLLLGAIGPLLYDEERSVQQNLFPVFKLIVEGVSTSQMAPHFQLLVAHLVCAVTRLDSGSKMFAVNCMDVILRSFPSLCRTNSELLSSFLDLLDTTSAGLIMTEKEKLVLLNHFPAFITAMIPSSVPRAKESGKLIRIDDSSATRAHYVSLIPEEDSAPFDFPLIYPDIFSVDLPLLERCEEMEKCLDKSIRFLHTVWLEMRTDSELGQLDKQKLSALRQVMEAGISLLQHSMILLNTRAASVSTEHFRARCKEIVGKKSFISSYSGIFPLKNRSCGYLNCLLAQFLLLCRNFVPVNVVDKWINIKKCEGYARKTQ